MHAFRYIQTITFIHARSCINAYMSAFKNKSYDFCWHPHITSMLEIFFLEFVSRLLFMMFAEITFHCKISCNTVESDLITQKQNSTMFFKSICISFPIYLSFSWRVHQKSIYNPCYSWESWISPDFSRHIIHSGVESSAHLASASLPKCLTKDFRFCLLHND